MFITHLVMFKLLKGATQSGTPAFLAAWARGCNTVISEGKPR